MKKTPAVPQGKHLKASPRVHFDTPNRGGDHTRPDVSFVGLGRLRKIAIIGSSVSVAHAPWGDSTWEFWAHSSSRHECERHGVRPTRYFDLHPAALWRQEKGWDPDYRKWLTSNTVPIFMQNRYPEVPASVRYPKDSIIAEHGKDGFSNQASWMIALALREGVTKIGIFGCDYTGTVERDLQRPGANYWAGFARGRGVEVVVSHKSTLLAPPGGLLYGYESHTADGLVPAYKPRPKAERKGPRRIKVTLLSDDLSKPRPPLRQDLEEPPAWERGGHPLPKQNKDGSFVYY